MAVAFIYTMRRNLLILFLFYSAISYAQKITIRGTAFDTTKGRHKVKIIVNDTIRKYSANKYYTEEVSRKLWSDYVVFTAANGEFEIKAEKSDSLFFKSYRYITKSYLVADLLKMKEIIILLEPEVCEPYIECHDTMPKHYVFIGEKIKVDYANQTYYCGNIISMDTKFNAVYKIIQNIYGNLSNDTIHFVAYDHYGFPEFGKHKYAMLFVSEYCNELYHMKYQYYDVYKTVKNEWAAPYHPDDYTRLDSSSTIKPEKIQFKEPLEIDISQDPKEWIEKQYPAPYYRIENGKAIALYGNYINELIELKKQTILKERKIILK